MQPNDKFVMELGKPASTKPPPSDSATATSSESNEMTVSTPVKATSPTSAPQLSIPHVSKCTCTRIYVSTYYVLLSIYVLVHRMVKMVVQWNLSIMVTHGPEINGCNREVAALKKCLVYYVILPIGA